MAKYLWQLMLDIFHSKCHCVRIIRMSVQGQFLRVENIQCLKVKHKSTDVLLLSQSRFILAHGGEGIRYSLAAF